MVQVGTYLKNIDNSGAKEVVCIGCLANYKQRYASVGDIITVSVKSLRKKRREFVKVQKGQVLKALIVRTKKNLTKFKNLSFFENSIILLNKQNKLIGTKIFGSLSKSLRYSKFLRVAFLARGLIL